MAGWDKPSESLRGWECLYRVPLWLGVPFQSPIDGREYHHELGEPHIPIEGWDSHIGVPQGAEDESFLYVPGGTTK